MGDGDWQDTGASPVSYRHHFLVLILRIRLLEMGVLPHTIAFITTRSSSSVSEAQILTFCTMIFHFQFHT